MPRRSLRRRLRSQLPHPEVLGRYLRYFDSKALFWNPQQLPPLDSPHLFGDHQPLQLEIGCGTGEVLCALAHEHPHTNYVGVDVAAKPLLRAVEAAAALALPNIVFIKGDVTRMYPLLAPGVLEAVYLHFPDPHMRQRFRKRRVLSPAFLDAIERALAPCGRLSIATDHQEYFMEILELLEGDARFEKAHAGRYLVGLNGPVRSQFQRIWERHGLPTLRVELRKAYAPAARVCGIPLGDLVNK
jgi:tRNA (guanine-N7-)-methyltransferase